MRPGTGPGVGGPLLSHGHRGPLAQYEILEDKKLPGCISHTPLFLIHIHPVKYVRGINVQQAVKVTQTLFLLQTDKLMKEQKVIFSTSLPPAPPSYLQSSNTKWQHVNHFPYFLVSSLFLQSFPPLQHLANPT